jgi:uncharacterized membrane protein
MQLRKQITAATLASSFAAALALAASPALAAPKPMRTDMEKCYGISLKADNDCAAGPAPPAPVPRASTTRAMPGST